MHDKNRKRSRCQCVAGVLLLAALLLTACGPQLHRPDTSSHLLALEKQRQETAAFDLWLSRQKRVFRIASRLMTNGAELCRDAVKPFFGVVLAGGIPTKFRGQAIRRGLSDALKVIYVLPDSPASKAGVLWGDIIVKLPIADRTGYKAVDLEVLRDGVTKNLSVKMIPSCDYELVITGKETVNAWADGARIGLHQGALRFASDDNELAFLIGHEIAHNALGHSVTKSGNAALGAVGGALLDIGLAFAGVKTGGAFSGIGGQIGMRAFSQDFEHESDYMAVYLMARAGYNAKGAMTFWRRRGAEKPQGIEKSYFSTHPSNPERVIAIDQAITEVSDKMRIGSVLVPEGFYKKPAEEEKISKSKSREWNGEEW